MQGIKLYYVLLNASDWDLIYAQIVDFFAVKYHRRKNIFFCLVCLL